MNDPVLNIEDPDKNLGCVHMLARESTWGSFDAGRTNIIL